MAESTEDKVRRVYNARKNAYGSARHNGDYLPPGGVRNLARLDTARIVGIPLAEVKAILAATAGPKTTRSPGDKNLDIQLPTE